MAYAVAYLLGVDDVMYKGGNLTLPVADMDRGVHQARRPITRSEPTIGISIGLEVDDMEAAVEELQAEGYFVPVSNTGE
jgi:hypothetical protein